MKPQILARANRRTVGVFARNRQPFVGSNISGRPHLRCGYGQLPVDYHGRFQLHQGAEDFYVVRSYETPIAWFANGQWHIPAVEYSITTAKHLSSLGVVDFSKWATTDILGRSWYQTQTV